MSGYLEVKYPFRSNLGLNPFKSWKRQWCILRPSPTFSGGILAVYCSEAGVSAGTIELPAGFVVRRAKSRTRPHAFAVFPADDPRKPRVLLAATTLQDAQVWMEKIKSLINGNKVLETEPLLKDSYSVAVNITEFSRKCGLSGADSIVTVSSTGVLVSRSQKLGVFVEWKHVTDATLSTDSDRNGTCIMTLDSDFCAGGGELRFSSPLAPELTAALRRALTDRGTAPKKLSKSDGDLRARKCSDVDLGDVRRSSWYSGPSEVSLDDLDLVMSKECTRIPCGQLSRCAGAGHLAAPAADNSMSDRRSLMSIASGIYEEIPDDVSCGPSEENVYCKMSRDRDLGLGMCLELSGAVSQCGPSEPQYECVQEGVSLYGTTRRPRRQPPPLPPRAGHSTQKSWWAPEGVTRHGSLGSLARPALSSLGTMPVGPAGTIPVGPAGTMPVGPAGTMPVGPAGTMPATKARTLPRWDRSRQAFSAFRKRLKSDSRATVSPKSEISIKDVETKKKKFDFAPTRDIFRTFRVNRKLKNLKITSNLGKGETKSCEYLDETEHVTTNRCSKSVECLEGSDEYSDGFDADLSIEFNDDAVTALTLPQGIMQLIFNRHETMTISLKDQVEGDYMPMSPIVPAPAIEHSYIVMSPRSNIA